MFHSGVADKQCSELLTRTMKERYLPPEPFYLGDWRNSSAAVSETAGGGPAPPSPAISIEAWICTTPRSDQDDETASEVTCPTCRHRTEHHRGRPPLSVCSVA